MFKDPYIGMHIDLSKCKDCNDRVDMHDNMNDMDFDKMPLGCLPIAMSYVPFQQWKETYSLDKGLARGTIFPELDLPFKGGMKR